jgi:hypothetical protein
MNREGEGSQQTTPAKIDLNDLLRQGEFDVSIKPAENEQDARERRWRERIAFAVAVSMLGISFLVCLGILIFGHASVEEQRWLQSALSLILGGAVGSTLKK